VVALLIALVVFIGAMLAVLASWTLGTRRSGHRPTAPERTPFLGGEEPEVHAWNRYHARYYLMALIFLAFDMEMVFMYPWAVVFVREGAIAMAEMAMFIGILLLGVLYGWRERAFTWA
jgi:NADH:ubiquinone oxidoreductase subunit 3 (subunit A)